MKRKKDSEPTPTPKRRAGYRPKFGDHIRVTTVREGIVTKEADDTDTYPSVNYLDKQNRNGWMSSRESSAYPYEAGTTVEKVTPTPAPEASCCEYCGAELGDQT